jgi:uncharacterized protein involved in exopolysaccharide biosynthesis
MAAGVMDAPYINLVQALWNHRYLLLLAGLLGGVCAAVASLIATPIYKAAVVVTEVQDRDAAKRLEGQSGTLTALANLSDVDPLAELTSDARVQQVLHSRQLAEEFVTREGLTPLLFPGAKRPVSPWFAARRFRERVVYAKQDKLKGATTVSMEWPDAKLAARWADRYVELANELIRASDLQTSQRKVAYLRAQAAGTEDVGVQRYLYQAVSKEAETAMFASGRDEYAFRVVDPAMPPELRIRPPRRLMTSLGASAGLFSAVVVVFALYGLYRVPSPPEPAPHARHGPVAC